MGDFVLTQYGGSSGGSAGDACLIQIGQRNLVVDFGTGTQQAWLLGDLKQAAYSAVVTHFHDDHCGTPALRTRAQKLWVNPTSTMPAHTNALDRSNCDAGANDQLIWEVTDLRLCARVWFIEGPGTAYHSQGENAHSAGIYGQLWHDGTWTYSWLLLGDMVSEAWANVAAVLPASDIIDYVKLPHHGSPNNHMAELFSTYVGAGTRLISSGYNVISSEWDKIRLSNTALQKDQIYILTHHDQGLPGSMWSSNQRQWLELKIDQAGAVAWRGPLCNTPSYGAASKSRARHSYDPYRRGST